jgi:hypothetical protein
MKMMIKVRKRLISFRMRSSFELLFYLFDYLILFQ